MQRTHDYRLRPAQLFIAAVGMFETAKGFTFVESISPGTLQSSQTHGQLARVYKDKDNRLHILYLPGKDNISIERVNGEYTHPLKNIRGDVDQALATTYQKEELDQAVRHFVVCLQNKTEHLKIRVEHYVYATLADNQLTVEDSMDRILTKYDVSGLQAAITDRPIITETNPNPEGGVSYKHIRRGWQLAIQSWQCGDYTLEAMSRSIHNNEPIKPIIKKENEVIAKHDTWFKSGNLAIKNAGPTYQSLPGGGHSDNSQDSEEQVASNHLENTNKPPFFSRLWVRNLSIALILIGAGILAAGITSLTGGFGAVLTPLIFGLAIGGCVAGGLLVVSGGAGMLGRLINYFSGKSQGFDPSRPSSNIFGTFRKVQEATSQNENHPKPNIDRPKKVADSSSDDDWVDIINPTPNIDQQAKHTPSYRK